MKGHGAHKVCLKIKREAAYYSKGTALEFPPLIYPAGGVAITKRSPEISRQLNSAVIINRKQDRDRRGETRGDEGG